MKYKIKVPHNKQTIIILGIALFCAVLGTWLIMNGRAATASISAEPEDAAVTAPVTKIANTNASGGYAVKFGGDTDTGDTVQPIAARRLMNGVGIDIHANFDAVWAGSNADELVAKLAATGVTYVRGMIDPGSAQTNAYAAALRKHNIKWEMTVAPTGQDPTPAESAAKVRKIAANYADLCIGLEGLNEPNNDRGGGAPRPDWVKWTVDTQRAIWQTAKDEPSLAHVKILGPALHAIEADNHPEQWTQLKNAGILQYQDYAGLHSYPSGYLPTTNLTGRLSDMRAAYGTNYPAWVTETGYSNNVGGSGNPVTEATSAAYIPRMFLELNLDHNTRVGYYEALDDPGSALEREFHFGWWRTPRADAASWTDKPTVAAVSNVFDALDEADTVGAYTPAPVILTVNKGAAADVKWYVVATKAQSDAGTASVLIYRNLPVNQKANTETAVAVAPVDVTITDRDGSRTVSVDERVKRIDLR